MKKSFLLLSLFNAYAGLGFNNPFVDSAEQSIYQDFFDKDMVSNRRDFENSKYEADPSGNTVIPAFPIPTGGKLTVIAPTAEILPIPTMSSSGKNNYAKRYSGDILEPGLFRRLVENSSYSSSEPVLSATIPMFPSSTELSKGELANNPIPQKDLELAKREIEKVMMENLSNEFDKMIEEKIPLYIQPIVLEDKTMFDFMIKEKYRGHRDKLIPRNDGIYSEFSMPLLNNMQIPVCYIVVDGDKLLDADEHKFRMMQASGNGFYTYYAGYLVGKCLADLEENYAIKAIKEFNRDNLVKLNIPNEALNYYFPKEFKPKYYETIKDKLASLNSSKQYKERLADIVGVLWANQQGYDVKPFVQDYRSQFKENSIFNTIPVLSNLPNVKNKHLNDIWDIAKGIQGKIGVSSAISTEYIEKPQYSETEQLKLNKVYKPDAKDK
jgi:hypothetical protein